MNISFFLNIVLSSSHVMTEKTGNKKLNRYITIILVIAIIAAVGIYAYTNFVKKEPPKSEGTTPPIVEPENTLLTISVGSQLYNYSLNDLITLDNVAEQGSYINQKGKLTEPNNYNGVALNVLLGTILSLSTNYTFYAIASDGVGKKYSIDELNGHVTIFNESRVEIGTGNFTMIVAYKQNDVFLNETTKGPV
jgi:hypothetical protein